MGQVLYKKKILKAQNGVSMSNGNLASTAGNLLTGILSGNKKTADNAQPNTTSSLVDTGVSLLGGNTSNSGSSGLVGSIFGSGSKGGGGMSKAGSLTGIASQGVNMLFDGISGGYESKMGGRYNLADTGNNSAGAAGVSSALNTASQVVGEGVGAPLLHGASEIIAGANQKKEANKVNEEYGINYKAYNGTGAGKVAGGAVEAVAGTLLNVFGVSGSTANLISGTLGKGVSTVVGILGDKGAAKKRVKEQNRMMNGITNIQQDQALGDSFERYATQMPHYDKYSNVRYAKKGGVIPSRFKKVVSYGEGGAVILGGQLHKEKGMFGKGNPILQNGEKIAETEREELLFNKQQTIDIENYVRLFEETGESDNLLKLGDLVKSIIIFETEDQSGKYKDLNG